MIKLMDIDERIQHHQAHVEHVNRHGWHVEAATSSRNSRPQGETGHSPRRAIGHAVVHFGEWLQGTPDVESTLPAPVNG